MSDCPVKKKAYYEANKVSILAKQKAKYDSRKDDPEYRAYLRTSRRISNRKRKGILNPTAETRHGECPICQRVCGLVCDHWHDGPKQGLIRGWLCIRCNSFLGGDRLERAVAYCNKDP